MGALGIFMLLFGFGWLARCCCGASGEIITTCTIGVCIDNELCSLYQIDISGIADNSCSECDEMNGTYFLTYPNGGFSSVTYSCVASGSCGAFLDLPDSHCDYDGSHPCYNRIEFRVFDCLSNTNLHRIAVALGSATCGFSDPGPRWIKFEKHYTDDTRIDCLGSIALNTQVTQQATSQCNIASAACTITALCG